MAKKAREKTEEAGSASVSPYGSVLGYEQVTSQSSRPITVVWPEYRTWFIGPCAGTFCEPRPYKPGTALRPNKVDEAVGL